MAHCPLCEYDIHNEFCVRPTGELYYRCPQCDLIHLDSKFFLSESDEKARYLQHENQPGDEGYLNFLRRLADPLIEGLTPQSQGLDYGAGPGPVLASYLTQKGFPTAVYDPYFYPDNSTLEARYDFITCTEAAEHFYHPKMEFERLFSLLKEGGQLGLMTEFAFEDLSPERFLKWYYARDPSHVCFYSERTFYFIAEKLQAQLRIPRPNVGIFQKLNNSSAF